MTNPTAEEIAAAKEVLALAGGNAASDAPPRYKVVESLQRGTADRVFLSTVSKKRAMAHIEKTVPRGSHHFLLNPDGTMESFEAERLTGGPRGEEYDSGWAPFDRESYQAPELAPANTNDPWADAWEGAQ